MLPASPVGINTDVTYGGGEREHLFSLKEDLPSVLRPHFDGCKHFISLDVMDVLRLGVSPLVLGSAHEMLSFAGDGGDIGLQS